MERTILKMIPVKSSCHFLFKDMGIMQCVGFKNKWVEDDESYMYGDGRCSIGDTISRTGSGCSTAPDDAPEDILSASDHTCPGASRSAGTGSGWE